MHRTPLLSVILGLSATTQWAGAASIGIKFLDAQDVAFGTATAGAPGYAQANWNFVSTDWSGNAANDALFTAGLVDSTGAAATTFQNVSYAPHADPVHYDAANTWRSGIGNATADDTLMNGYLDDGNNDQPYVNISLDNTVTSSTIVLYFHGDSTTSVGRYWLEEWSDSLTAGTVITNQVGISSNDYAGTYISAGMFSQTASPTNVDVATGNYIVFENITAHNIRIRAAGNGDPAGEDFGRGPLNAVQIITVPEPSGALLAALGGLAVALRRRRN